MNFDFDVAAFAVALFNALYGAYFLISRPRKKEGRQRLVKKAAFQALIGSTAILLLVLISPALRASIGWAISHLFYGPSGAVTDVSLMKQYSFTDESKVHILVAPFKEYGNPDKSSKTGIILADYVSTELERNSIDSTLQIDVRLLPEKLVPYLKSHNDAILWGDSLNADIVVWGEITPPLFNFQEFFISPNLTLVRAIRGFGSKIHLSTIRGVSPRPLDIPFPKQLLQSPYQLGLFLIGYSFYLKSNYDGAIHYFQKAISYSNNLGSTYIDNLYYYLGSSFFRKANSTGDVVYFSDSLNTDLERAKENFKTSLSLNPKNVYALNGLGAICIAQYRPDYKESITYFQKAIEIDSTILFAYANLALAYMNFQQPDEALSLLKKGLKIAEGFPDEMQSEKVSIWTLFAMAYNFKGEFFKAESLYVEALKLAPKERVTRIYAELAYTLWRQNKIDKALQILIEGDKIYPQDLLIVGNLGAVYFEKGEYQKGLFYSKQAIKSVRGDLRASFLFNIFGYYCIEANKDSAGAYFELLKEWLNVPLLGYNGLSTLQWILYGNMMSRGFDEKILSSPTFRRFIAPYLSGIDIEKTVHPTFAYKT